jgi:aerobic-type carbon monoxide dehydrogenase small subunit (CoxS/CutS family)
VRVDPAGQHGQAAQVVVHRAGSGIDGRDLRAAHDDAGVAQHATLAVVLLDNQVTRSCTLRLAAASGKAITTIEGIAEGDQLHPVQEAFLEAEAFQCGYCTPGMVMATIGLLRTTPDPTDQEIAKLMDRNVCRCGTYPRITQAIKLAAERVRTRTLAGRQR